MLDLGRTILRLEKARRELMAVDPGDREKLLAAGRKVDKLMSTTELKLGPRTSEAAAGNNRLFLLFSGAGFCSLKNKKYPEKSVQKERWIA
ncbi:hypothetical protein [Desulfofundulus sp.]|uniref:hypothetical protein n=1 Tax=Desulfofundulus sp. TaxID=2282750 RepID=UPI003C710C1C